MSSALRNPPSLTYSYCSTLALQQNNSIWDPVLPMNLSDGSTVPSREEVSEYLRVQRKGNRKKACFPCHGRKVRCDGSRPCKRCVDGGHPAMCGYEPAESDYKKRKTVSMESATINSARRTTEKTTISKSSVPVSVSRGHCGEQNFTPTDQFVGSSSVPGLIVNGMSHVDERELGMSNNELRNLLLPALGLARADYTSSTEPEEVTSALLHVTEALPRGSEVIRSVNKWHARITQTIGSDMSLGCSNNTSKSYIL